MIVDALLVLSCMVYSKPPSRCLPLLIYLPPNLDTKHVSLISKGIQVRKEEEWRRKMTEVAIGTQQSSIILGSCNNDTVVSNYHHCCCSSSVHATLLLVWPTCLYRCTVLVLNAWPLYCDLVFPGSESFTHCWVCFLCCVYCCSTVEWDSWEKTQLPCKSNLVFAHVWHNPFSSSSSSLDDGGIAEQMKWIEISCKL